MMKAARKPPPHPEFPPLGAGHRPPHPSAIGPAAVSPSPVLLLACGNSLRQDDGVGLRIAEAAERLFPASQVRVIAAQQFTPEMSEELAHAELAIFVDACVTDEPGAIRMTPLTAGSLAGGTHRIDPPALLAMAAALCGHAPARAFALTIGADSFGYGEELSGALRRAVPRALRLLSSLIGARSARA